MEGILKKESLNALEEETDIEACKSLVILVNYYRENGLNEKALELERHTREFMNKIEERYKIKSKK